MFLVEIIKRMNCDLETLQLNQGPKIICSLGCSRAIHELQSKNRYPVKHVYDFTFVEGTTVCAQILWMEPPPRMLEAFMGPGPNVIRDCLPPFLNFPASYVVVLSWNGPLKTWALRISPPCPLSSGLAILSIGVSVETETLPHWGYSRSGLNNVNFIPSLYHYLDLP